MVPQKDKLAEAARLVLVMWEEMFQAFMEHNRELIDTALEKEDRLNELEKELVTLWASSSSQVKTQKEKKKLTACIEVVGDLEIIGDYCKDILERVQIKIEERLLFSEEAVEEYKDLYGRCHHLLEKICQIIEKEDDLLLKVVLKYPLDINKEVFLYRQRHDLRILEGKCSPMAGNMFLNILDFTASAYAHAMRVVKRLREVLA